MSVICCNIPNLLCTLANQPQPTLNAHPTALLGPDNSIWAVGPQAHAMGIMPQMKLRQALSFCPELVLHQVDFTECQDVQNTMLATLAKWELPLEEIGWGQAYL